MNRRVGGSQLGAAVFFRRHFVKPWAPIRSCIRKEAFFFHHIIGCLSRMTMRRWHGIDNNKQATEP